MPPLTRRQSQTLAFIRAYQAEHGGISPTTGEIAEGVGLASKSGVVRLLNGLAERGAIRRIPNRSRAIEIVEQGLLSQHTDVLLTIAAHHDGISRSELIARLVADHCKKIGLPGLLSAARAA